jgi:imidazolonepropionase-like amidohydrolase
MGIGTDSGGTPMRRFGFYYEELACYARAGVPAAEILRTATSGNVEILGMADDIGSIRPGLKADLIACSGDPTRDISALFVIDLVIRDGSVKISRIHPGGTQ